MREYESWAPYVPVGERRRRAEKEIKTRGKQGESLSPVCLPGRAIANSFWGKAWCQNLESFSDYANRLPRGRSYVRNGSVIDLRIEAGAIQALVQGSNLYRVRIGVKAVAHSRWQQMVGLCAGSLGSMVELLSGRISQEVMRVVSERGRGLFPAPTEIDLSCSCPDWAKMCKHVAATLYGVAARLDVAPELIFTLRQVDPTDLITKAGAGLDLATTAKDQVLDAETNDLNALFGIDLGGPLVGPPAPEIATRPAAAPPPTVVRESPGPEAPQAPKPLAKGKAKTTDKAKKTRDDRSPPAPAKAKPSSRKSTAAEPSTQEQVAAMKALLKRLRRIAKS